VLHARRVERRAPALLVVARELEVVALSGHPDGDVADARPGIEPGPQRLEGAAEGRSRKPGEAECCSQKLAALVEHRLLNHLVGPQQDRLRNRKTESLGGFDIENELELGGLLDREISWVRSLENSIDVARCLPISLSKA
jgi:hypothetical protein